MRLKLGDIFMLQLEKIWNTRIIYSIYENGKLAAEYEKEVGDNELLPHHIENYHNNQEVDRVDITRNGIYQINIHLKKNKKADTQLIKANKLYKGVKIKQCPFCGESEEIYLEEYETKVGNRWRLFCANCMAGIDRGYDQTAHALIEAWNKRKKCIK